MMFPTWDSGASITWADAELPLLWIGEHRPRLRNVRAGTVRSTVRARVARQRTEAA